MTQEAQLKACPDEDWFEEVIGDSLEMDWVSRDAAKAIVRRWSEAWYPEDARTPDSVISELVEAAKAIERYLRETPHHNATQAAALRAALNRLEASK